MEYSSLQKKIVYTIFLFVISHYAGTIGNDITLTEGKNVVTFMFYYIVGHLLSQTKNMWKKINRKRLLIVYIIVNVIIVAFGSLWGSDRFINGIFEFCFIRYNSPFLWLNAILTFMLITSLSFQSKIINRAAKACLSIYLLHCSFIAWRLIKPAMLYLMDFSNSFFVTFALTCVMALVIVFICICIHFMLTPLWYIFEKIGIKLQNCSDKLWSHLEESMRIEDTRI